jgi:DNA-binding IclR family transcriptional regulator
LLDVLAASTGPMTLRDLAAGAAMSASKARRYLVSLIKCGIAEQDVATSRYDLGEMSLRLGVAALHRTSAVRIATLAAIELNQTTDETIALSVWGEHGPTIIAWQDSSKVVICNLNVGSVLPILRSASGRVFLSFLPRKATRGHVKREIAGESPDARGAIRTTSDVNKIVAQVRRQRLAVTRGEFLPGLSAVAAPIFDFQGRLVAVMAMLGRQGSFEKAQAHEHVATLTETANSVSRRLGLDKAGERLSLVEWLERDGRGTEIEQMPPQLAWHARAGARSR